ncbi:MAG: HAD hydrolase-like protein, partial [Bacteroidota bacterium]
MKYVIFDIDGTLTNTKKVEDKCFARAFEETFNINIDDQQWEAFKNVTDWGITEEIIMRETGREPSQFQYSSMIDNFIRHLQEERDKEQNQ